MANWPAYRALKAESQRLGYPILYHTDLTLHDRRILARKDAPDQFGWILRRYGTHLYRPGPDWESVEARDITKYRTDDPHFYWWDGTSLSEVTAEEFVRELKRRRNRAL